MASLGLRDLTIWYTGSLLKWLLAADIGRSLRTLTIASYDNRPKSDLATFFASLGPSLEELDWTGPWSTAADDGESRQRRIRNNCHTSIDITVALQKSISLALAT